MMNLAIILTTLIAALPAWAQDYPMTITHKFGTTVIEDTPERVASVDYAGAGDLLALGVQPVAIRYWYGDYENAVWPWAQPLLTTMPEILRGDLNFEQIAATEPDVIIAIWSGIDQNEYEQLSQIAPVVAVPEGVGDYAMAWDDRALLTGRVIGKLAEAEAQISAIRERLAHVAESHPEWDGMTASVAFVTADGPGAYTATDIRPQILASLGFQNPPAVEALAADGAFSVYFSEEALEPLNADMIIWIDADDHFGHVRALATRPFLPAVQDGREVFMGKEITGAFSHATLLSLRRAIDLMVPMFEAALDGNSSTHADDR